jgi:type VI secretion system protein ImpM
MAGKFGAFGKMPSLGDFFRVDVAPSFVDPWDRWLQEAILAAKGALGERWQDCYFSAPIWRFTLAAGNTGAAAMLGVMMMSVDRVGRQFPLTLATPLPDGVDAVQAHLSAPQLFYDLEGVALAALEDGFTREALAEKLTALTPAAPPAVLAVARGIGGLVAEGGDAAGLAAGLAGSFLGSQFRRPSLWSADLETGVRLMVCEGLPAGGQALGLFDLSAQIWQRDKEPVDA